MIYLKCKYYYFRVGPGFLAWFYELCVFSQGMHPAFIGAQYPFSVASGPHPPMAATAVTFPGVPVPSMTQIAVHPYHTAEAGLPLSTTVAGKKRKSVCETKLIQNLFQCIL